MLLFLFIHHDFFRSMLNFFLFSLSLFLYLVFVLSLFLIFFLNFYVLNPFPLTHSSFSHSYRLWLHLCSPSSLYLFLFRVPVCPLPEGMIRILFVIFCLSPTATSSSSSNASNSFEEEYEAQNSTLSCYTCLNPDAADVYNGWSSESSFEEPYEARKVCKSVIQGVRALCALMVRVAHVRASDGKCPETQKTWVRFPIDVRYIT